jgi:hypothetical protein
MLGVGVIEIVAALLVAFIPAIGAWIVVALCGIILNLLSIPGYYGRRAPRSRSRVKRVRAGAPRGGVPPTQLRLASFC